MNYIYFNFRGLYVFYNFLHILIVKCDFHMNDLRVTNFRL